MNLKAIVGSYKSSSVPGFAGSTWVRLQYVLGLRQLGIETFWVDHLNRLDPFDTHRSLDYLHRRFSQTARDFGLEDHYCIIYDEGEDHFGMSERQFEQLARDTDLLVDVAGHLPDNSVLGKIPRRVYIDVDPGFTQLWALETDMCLEKHNFFFTVGQNVPDPSFEVPVGSIPWEKTLPPVVLDEWPARIDPACPRFSTVADWRGSQHVMHGSRFYSGKRTEFLKFLDFPTRVDQEIALALCIGYGDFEDIGTLCKNGWLLLDPYRHAGEPHGYREFIQHSRGEFSVAKNGYVDLNTGWVSDRTVAYLSSGKPVLIQSTGFEDHLPTGEGLLTFRTPEEAIAGMNEINSDYLAHCRAARAIAETHFDSSRVLGRILDKVGL